MSNYSISSFPDAEKEKKGRIELTGELSIQYVHEIKKELENIFFNWDIIDLHICDVSMIDLSMLQYLISLKKAEKTSGKNFNISFDLSEEINELMEHAGFVNIEKLSG